MSREASRAIRVRLLARPFRLPTLHARPPTEVRVSEVEPARAAPPAADEPRDGQSAAQAEDLPPADETTELQRLQQELDAVVRERQELYERHLRLAAEF